MKINFRLDNRSNSELKPILIQITHQGKQIKRSTGCRMTKKEWVKDSGKTSEVWSKLSLIRSFIDSEIFNFVLEFGEDPTIEDVKKMIDFETKKEEETTQITVLISKFIKAKEKIYSESRIHGYNRVLELINEFISDSDFKDDHSTINKTWVLSFIDFLCYTKEYTNSTVESILKRLRSVLNFYDIKMQFKMAEVMQGMRGKKIKNEIPFLTLEELEHLFNKTSLNEQEDNVRDLFVFCAYTGMRFNECQNLTKDNFFYNGKMRMTRYTTSKNGITITVPLNHVSEKIVREHNGELPKISNAKANEVLHKILRDCGFTEEYKTVHYNGKNRVEKIVPLCDLLTFHDSRKAFGCNLIEGGLDFQSVSDLMGINIDTLQKWYSKSNKQDRNLKALKILNR